MIKNLTLLFSSLSFFTFSGLSAYTCYDYEESFWFNADWLCWKIQDTPKLLPILVEGPVVPDGAPILGLPGTSIVLGNEKVDTKWRSGGRFSVGYWCDNYQRMGVEANYFFLANASRKQNITSDGAIDAAFLAVPYIDATTGLESSIALAFPDAFSGTAQLKIANSMQGAELNSMVHITFNNHVQMNVLGGLRYLNFKEKLTFNTNSPLINTAGNVYTTQDKFKMLNNFYGAQLGFDINFEFSPVFLNVKAKIACGVMDQKSHVKGSFTTNDFTGDQSQVFQGGYYALPSNIGSHNQTRFSVIPEVDVNLGYHIANGFSITAGYNFLFITNVLRPGKQLNRRINPTQSALYEFSQTPVLAGTARPKNSMKLSDLWVQGVNVGLEYRF